MSGLGGSSVKRGLERTFCLVRLLDRAVSRGGFLSPCRNRCHCLSSSNQSGRQEGIQVAFLLERALENRYV